MNKIIIPSILGIIILVAGIFAFSPIEQASTTHTTIVQQVAEDVSGSSLTVTSQEFSNTFAAQDEVFQMMWLESTVGELFTIKDITVTGTIGANFDGADTIQVEYIAVVDDGFASTPAGIQAASDDGDPFVRACDTCSDKVLDGVETLDTRTWSWNAAQWDAEDYAGLTVGPNSKLYIEVSFNQPNDAMQVTCPPQLNFT